MKFKVDLNAIATPGNFGCRVEPGFLVMPEQTLLYAASVGMNRVEFLAGYSETFPTTVADHFNWTVAQAKEANEGLYKILEDAGMKLDRTVHKVSFGLG